MRSTIRLSILQLFLGVLLLFLLLTSVFNPRTVENIFVKSVLNSASQPWFETINKEKSPQNPLDGCYHVYLDVGSNVGIQVRKLFEPKLYPRATVHRVFDEFFNRTEKHKEHLTAMSSLPVCSVGFEPNSHHAQALKDIEEAYRKCGLRAKFYTNTAVSEQEGSAIFFSDKDYSHLEWGGTIINPKSNLYSQIKDKPVGKLSPDSSAQNSTNITLVRLSKFINDIVATRKLPTLDHNVAGKPKVLMKMDIEGSEVEVLPDLLMQGSLQYIDGLMVEFHVTISKNENRKLATKYLKTVFENLGKLTGSREYYGHKMRMLSLDDETYFASKYELPNCGEETHKH